MESGRDLCVVCGRDFRHVWRSAVIFIKGGLSFNKKGGHTMPSCNHPNNCNRPNCGCCCNTCRCPAGARGPAGPPGVEGPPGQGIRVLGEYASYLDFIANHPTGTSGEAWLVEDDLFIWIEGLPGHWLNTGPLAGVAGPTGATGPQGVQGIQGIQGPTGPEGPTGPQGVQGIQGIQGSTGLEGPTGPEGIQGSTGPEGPTGPEEPIIIAQHHHTQKRGSANCFRRFLCSVRVIFSAPGRTASPPAVPAGPWAARPRCWPGIAPAAAPPARAGRR